MALTGRRVAQELTGCARGEKWCATGAWATLLARASAKDLPPGMWVLPRARGSAWVLHVWARGLSIEPVIARVTPSECVAETNLTCQ